MRKPRCKNNSRPTNLYAVVWPLLRISRQTIGQMNPRQPVLNPRVVIGRHRHGVVETANGDVNFQGIRVRQEGQRRAALATERAQPPGPSHLARFSCSEAKAAAAERGPGYEGCPTASATVQTMTVGNVVSLTGRLITHRAAQTAARDHVLSVLGRFLKADDYLASFRIAQTLAGQAFDGLGIVAQRLNGSL